MSEEIVDEITSELRMKASKRVSNGYNTLKSRQLPQITRLWSQVQHKSREDLDHNGINVLVHQGRLKTKDVGRISYHRHTQIHILTPWASPAPPPCLAAA